MESELDIAHRQLFALAEQKRQLEEALARGEETISRLESEKGALNDRVAAFELHYADRDQERTELIDTLGRTQMELSQSKIARDSIQAQLVESRAALEASRNESKQAVELLNDRLVAANARIAQLEFIVTSNQSSEQMLLPLI